MKKKHIPPAHSITSDAGLRQLAETLSAEPLLAVDTESNNMYAYQEQVCLIQLSTRSADYIVDPLMIADLSPLGELMADPGIEKVFHAAEYDIMCLKRDFGYTFANLFDTMIAARICGCKEVGLNALLRQHLGVRLDKSHQRDNWALRPLPHSALQYAQSDTHYLPALRDYFHAQLVARGHVEEAGECFAELSRLPAASARSFDPVGFWSIGQPYNLPRGTMAVLRALYLLREALAQERDRPPFKILSNRTLVALAERAPQSIRDLKGIEGMTSSQIRRYGERILRAVAEGKDTNLRPPPRHVPPDPVVTERYTQLHSWRKARAEERGVESDVIISRQALWAIARALPESLDELADVAGIGPWRLQTYGPELLDMVAAYRRNGHSQT